MPRRELTPDEAIKLVRHIQHGNYKAKVSHYRKATRPRDGPK